MFSVEEENKLENYLIKSSKLQYGLTYKQVRDLAYSYCVKLERKLAKNWETNQTAEINFLRNPENTSLARNINFKEQNVNIFQ